MSDSQNQKAKVTILEEKTRRRVEEIPPNLRKHFWWLRIVVRKQNHGFLIDESSNDLFFNEEE